MTPADRMSIQALLQANLSGPAIAQKLGFSRSAINREINRGKLKPTSLAADYRAGAAQERSQQRRCAAGTGRRKLGSNTQTPLWRTVIDGLRCRWSPQQIAGKLPAMNKPVSLASKSLPAAALSVSHETSTARSTPCLAARCEPSWLACCARATIHGCRARVVLPARVACPTDQHQPASTRGGRAHRPWPLGR